jgi:hypothetical protein
LSLQNTPAYCAPVSPCSYGPVNADGGKSLIGGYRAERNDLLKFIADNKITNVVFLSADDHQNRVNEVTYSPSGATGDQSTYVKVPFALSIVAGPLGATGPDLFTNHTFAAVEQLANSIATAQQSAGIEPLGLIGYPGVQNVKRDVNGTLTPAVSLAPVHFYSPDTFTFVVFDVPANGRTLSVKAVGMNATAQNAAPEYVDGQAKTVFSFDLDALTVASRGAFVLDRRSNKFVQQVTVTNNTGSTLTGPVNVILTGLSSNTSLANATGSLAADSPYITVPASGLAAGGSVNVVLQFTRPVSGSITYGTRVIDTPVAP